MLTRSGTSGLSWSKNRIDPECCRFSSSLKSKAEIGWTIPSRWTMFFVLFELHVRREADFDVLWMKQLIFEWHRCSQSLERDLSPSTHDVFQSWLRPEKSCGLCWTKLSLAALMDGCTSSLIWKYSTEQKRKWEYPPSEVFPVWSSLSIKWVLNLSWFHQIIVFDQYFSSLILFAGL